MVSSREMDMDEWLTHSGSSGGAGYLKNWKKDGQVDIWLHPATGMAALWAHGFARVVRMKDEKTNDYVLKVRRIRFNSYERESVLRKQRFRNNDGTREYPPEVCPFSLTLEWVREQIADRKIGWCDPIFRFEAGGDDDQVIHAGGFTGIFGKKDMTEAEKRELRRAGIRRDEAFMENSTARLQYVFRVVQNDEPGDGCVIAIESQTLGDKMKKLINDRREDLGKDEGDPRKHPVCFRWRYDESEEFSNKYDAKVITSIKLSDEIKRVFDAEPPAIDELIGPSNVAVLRQLFETHWCHETVDPPWAELFEPITKFLKKENPSLLDLPESFDHGANASDNDEDDDEDDEGEDDEDDDEGEDDEEVECDSCKKPMAADALTCPHCGAEYEYDANNGTYKLKPKPEPKPETRRVDARVSRRQREREAAKGGD